MPDVTGNSTSRTGVDSGVRRSLLTILFTDIVGSTDLAGRVGDRQWRGILAGHNAILRECVRGHRGEVVRTVGDGIIAIFESPGDAIMAALEATDRVHEMDLCIRAGLHTGEIDVVDGDIAGIGVHIGARIVDLAGPDEVLVSATVSDLATGGDFVFTPRGSHQLRGVTGRKRVFAATRAAHADLATTGREGLAPRLPTVLVVDDHPLWRQTLRSVLDSGQAALVAAEAGSGAEAIELVNSVRPDVVLMDIEMPGMSGIETTRAIVATHPECRVLILSSTGEDRLVLQAVRAGASGYILKTSGARDILEAVRRVSTGEVAFPPELSRVVLSALRGATDAQPGALDDLTAREREVLQSMAQGLTNQAIAAALHLSLKTIETHVATVFSKLGIEGGADQHRRVAAVLAYLKETAERASGKS